MAFLFKSKKNQQGTALPPATRNVHTSEGAPSSGTPPPPLSNGSKVEGNAFAQTPTPSSSYNNSLNSAMSPTSPDNARLRQRAESESQVSPQRISMGGKQCCKKSQIPDPGDNSGPATTASPQWCTSAEPELVSLPLVAASHELFLASNESFPAVWCSYQCGCFQGG